MPAHALSRFERLLTLFTVVRPGEGKSVFILFLHAFLLLLAYYLIRPVREALILTEANPEIRSYATAVMALVLLIVIPLYGVLFRYHGNSLLIQRVNIFFVINLILLAMLGFSGLQFGFEFFVWLGIFSVMVVTQFWAFAADLYNVKSGQRLFAIIAVGASSGAWLGSKIAALLIGTLGPYGLMLASAGVITTTLVLSRLAERAIPEDSRSLPTHHEQTESTGPYGGFAVVFKDRYLVLIALFVVLLNGINTTGEYVLAEYVVSQADLVVGSTADDVARGNFIGAFYGDFYAWITLTGLLTQLFLVSRLIIAFGIRGVVFVVPLMLLVGYALIGFVPVFAVIQIVIIAQKSADYSLMNTVRNALFLPTSRAAKYEGKTTIETFFWRFGDVLSAGAVYLGNNVINIGVREFVFINIGLSLAMLITALLLGRRYRVLMRDNVRNVAPELHATIPDGQIDADGRLHHVVPYGTFIDRDPGDALTLSASLHDDRALPGWLSFNASRQTFYGIAPGRFEELVIKVTATDMEGLSVSETFVLRRRLGGTWMYRHFR